MAVLVVSLVAHVVALSTLPVVPSTTATAHLNTVDISFTIPPPPVAPAVAPVEPGTSEPPTPTKATEATPPQRTPATTSPDRPAAAKPSVTWSTLDAKSTARAFVLSQQTAPESSQSEREGPDTAEAEKRNYFEGTGTKTYLSRREPPTLRRHQDGTYHYKGHAFKAIVETDGSVTFDDGYKQGSTIAFDVTDLMMRRRGEDPYRVQKRWFLEDTAELRQELLESWRAKQNLIALRKLRGRLLRISEDETLSDRQRADRVIAMFRDTADDEAGAAARNTIEEFVANRMPSVDLPHVSSTGR